MIALATEGDLIPVCAVVVNPGRELMDDNWQFYFAFRDDKLASITVNLGLEAIAPDAKRPWLIGIRIKMKTPSPNGMAAVSEGPVFDRIQACLESALRKELDGVGVGIVSSGGWWELYYYAPSAKGFPDFLANAMREFAGYERMTFSREDKGWTMYRQSLAPSAEKRNQQILNREVIQSVKNLGWDGKSKLRVDHTFLFANAERRSQAMAMALKEGYEVTSQFEMEPGSAPGFGLQISRVDFPEEHMMQATVFHLIDLANSLGGKYDGWGAMVKG
jgi:regulator of RNase E activity RraB